MYVRRESFGDGLKFKPTVVPEVGQLMYITEIGQSVQFYCSLLRHSGFELEYRPVIGIVCVCECVDACVCVIMLSLYPAGSLKGNTVRHLTQSQSRQLPYNTVY